jgi:hypothetical protein
MEGEHIRNVPTSSLSSAAQEFVGWLIDAVAQRETRVGHALAFAVVRGLITPAECTIIADLAEQRWHELNEQYEPSASWSELDASKADQVPAADLTWTPTRILDALPRQRVGEPAELDARTRQLPVRDRD